MFNDEKNTNQKVMVDIIFEEEFRPTPQEIEYLYHLKRKYDLESEPIKSQNIRVKVSISKYRNLIRDLINDNIESNLVIH